MKTFFRRSLPEEIKYNNKVWVYAPAVSATGKKPAEPFVVVEVLQRSLEGVRDLHGNFYKPRKHYFIEKK